MRDTGSEIIQSFFLGLLAEAYQKNGQVEEGLATVAEALAFVERTEERFYEAELWRIYGELALRAGEEAKRRTGEKAKVAPSPDLPVAPSSPEECFLKAIEISTKQQAKSLELRATMSLSRLWQQQALEQSAKSEEVSAGNTEQSAKRQEYGAGSRKQEARTKLTEAHKLLSDVYNWFTEGFDTKDLQEAKALLEELS